MPLVGNEVEFLFDDCGVWAQTIVKSTWLCWKTFYSATRRKIWAQTSTSAVFCEALSSFWSTSSVWRVLNRSRGRSRKLKYGSFQGTASVTNSFSGLWIVPRDVASTLQRVHSTFVRWTHKGAEFHRHTVQWWPLLWWFYSISESDSCCAHTHMTRFWARWIATHRIVPEKSIDRGREKLQLHRGGATGGSDVLYTIPLSLGIARDMRPWRDCWYIQRWCRGKKHAVQDPYVIWFWE